jgi:hypothetical protein
MQVSPIAFAKWPLSCGPRAAADTEARRTWTHTGLTGIGQHFYAVAYTP